MVPDNCWSWQCCTVAGQYMHHRVHHSCQREQQLPGRLCQVCRKRLCFLSRHRPSSSRSNRRLLGLEMVFLDQWHSRNTSFHPSSGALLSMFYPTSPVQALNHRQTKEPGLSRPAFVLRSYILLATCSTLGGAGACMDISHHSRFAVLLCVPPHSPRFC